MSSTFSFFFFKPVDPPNYIINPLKSSCIQISKHEKKKKPNKINKLYIMIKREASVGKFLFKLVLLVGFKDDSSCWVIFNDVVSIYSNKNVVSDKHSYLLSIINCFHTVVCSLFFRLILKMCSYLYASKWSYLKLMVYDEFYCLNSLLHFKILKPSGLGL